MRGPIASLGALLILAGGYLAGRERARQLAGGYPLPGEADGLADFPAPAAPIPADPPPLPAAPPILSRGGRLSPAEVAALIDPAYGVPVADALAYVEVESSFNPTAYRFESHLGEASWGLMQVLESTARDRGLIGGPDQMFIPEIGLQLGLAHVAWTRDFLASRGAPADPVAVALAYNAGVGNALRGNTVARYGQRWQAARARYLGQGLG